MLKSILDRIKSEPVLVLGAVTSAVTAAAAFGLELSAEQVSAITALTAAVLSVIVRQKVTPV
jgi:hypothetical protein